MTSSTAIITINDNNNTTAVTTNNNNNNQNDINKILKHIKTHLLFLFYILYICNITPNSLQWCCIMMNFPSATAYLFASLYIQHARYDAQPVWVKY
eukprot:UN09698